MSEKKKDCECGMLLTEAQVAADVCPRCFDVALATLGGTGRDALRRLPATGSFDVQQATSDEKLLETWGLATIAPVPEIERVRGMRERITLTRRGVAMRAHAVAAWGPKAPRPAVMEMRHG